MRGTLRRGPATRETHAEARDFAVDTYHAIEGGNQTLGRLDAFLAGAAV